MARRYINHQENKNPHYKIKPRLKANSGKTLMMECANKKSKILLNYLIYVYGHKENVDYMVHDRYKLTQIKPQEVKSSISDIGILSMVMLYK